MEKKWWKKSVVYQIYPKSFYDSNGDGIGDIQGIIKKLPYLKELGVDAVWICPFYPSPMDDNGYDISDYYNISNEFGQMKDFDQLMEQSKEYNIKIIIDMVLNHSSDEHWWFQEALKDKNSKYRDFYIFKEQETCPSNARSVFGGSTWKQVSDGSWYYHTFGEKQPDFNWENKELRQELYKMMNFWMDKGVWGFRMDAITYIKKDINFPSLQADENDGLFACAKTSLNQPGILDFLQEMKRETYGKKDMLVVAEAPGVPYEELPDFVGEHGVFSMLFDFEYTDIDVKPDGNWYQLDHSFTNQQLFEAIKKSQESVSDTVWGAIYLENHDQPRSIDKYFYNDIKKIGYKKEMASALASMYFFLKGTPFIYEGQEIGMTNCNYETMDMYDDINSKDQYEKALSFGYTKEKALEFINRRSRDNGRTPMQWSKEENAGFSKGVPWLTVNKNYMDINVENQLNKEDSIFSFYKKMIDIFKSETYTDVFASGEIRFPSKYDMLEHVFCYERVYKNKVIRVTTNLSGSSIKLHDCVKKVLLTNFQVEDTWNENEFVLSAYGCIIEDRSKEELLS